MQPDTLFFLTDGCTYYVEATGVSDTSRPLLLSVADPPMIARTTWNALRGGASFDAPPRSPMPLDPLSYDPLSYDRSRSRHLDLSAV